jgi:hypothetical protein
MTLRRDNVSSAQLSCGQCPTALSNAANSLERQRENYLNRFMEHKEVPAGMRRGRGHGPVVYKKTIVALLASRDTRGENHATRTGAVFPATAFPCIILFFPRFLGHSAFPSLAARLSESWHPA